MFQSSNLTCRLMNLSSSTWVLESAHWFYLKNKKPCWDFPWNWGLRSSGGWKWLQC